MVGSQAANEEDAMAEAAVKPRTSETTATAPHQDFVVNHHRDEDFHADGLRDYAAYRDLGIAKATDGMVRAHVIRFTEPCSDKVRKRHFHDVQFQMVYVLKGWMKSEFEGQGTHVMKAGSSWIQPPGIKHTVLDYSEDCEVLEIILPADFDTTEV
jgi:hypothetical protein